MRRRYIALFLIGAVIFFAAYRHYQGPGSPAAVQASASAVAVASISPIASPVVSTGSHCSEGYILIPHNDTYHTTDFCVMKYEAKCAYIATPTVGIQPKSGEAAFGASKSNPEGVYKNDAVGSACVTANGRVVVSTASGSPITFIVGSDPALKDTATNYCDGILAHLITNDEWMTIARNVEQMTANWCDRNGTNCDNPPGTPGKILANGYNDYHNEPAASGGGIGALIASDDDTKACYGTTTDGSNTCGSKYSQKRTLTLSNGQVIWDLAGNVWEWTATTTLRKDEPASTTNGALDLGWATSDFTKGSTDSVITNNGSGPTLGYDAFRPSNDSWNSNQGMGRIYHYGAVNDTDTTVYDFLRGGNWRHGSDDGVYTIHLSPSLTKAGIDDVGFRCVKPAQ